MHSNTFTILKQKCGNSNFTQSTGLGTFDDRKIVYLAAVMTDVSFIFKLNPDQDADCTQTIRSFKDSQFVEQSTSLQHVADEIGPN